MVWYAAGNESLHGTDLSKNWWRESENSRNIAIKEHKEMGEGLKLLEGEVRPREVCFCF